MEGWNFVLRIWRDDNSKRRSFNPFRRGLSERISQEGMFRKATGVPWGSLSKRAADGYTSTTVSNTGAESDSFMLDGSIATDLGNLTSLASLILESSQLDGSVAHRVWMGSAHTRPYPFWHKLILRSREPTLHMLILKSGYQSKYNETDMDAGFESLCKGMEVPDDFMKLLVSHKITTTEDFALMAASESEVKSDIFAFSRAGGVELKEIKAQVSIKKLWLAEREADAWSANRKLNPIVDAARRKGHSEGASEGP